MTSDSDHRSSRCLPAMISRCWVRRNSFPVLDLEPMMLMMMVFDDDDDDDDDDDNDDNDDDNDDD